MPEGDGSLESRVAVLESRVDNIDKAGAAMIIKLDETLTAVSQERREMAEQRGTLQQFKVLIPILTGLLGFMGGTLVTVIVTHLV